MAQVRCWFLLISVILGIGGIPIWAQKIAKVNAAQEEIVKKIPVKVEAKEVEEKKEEIKPKELVKEANPEKKAAEEEIEELKAAEEVQPEEMVEEVKPEEKAEEIEEVKDSEEVQPEELVEEAKSEEEKVIEPEAEIEGFDTVDLESPAGNWLLKRIWWEKAQNKFNKIRINVNKVADSIMPFFAQQNAFEKSVMDPFYRDIGLEQGELQEIINTLIAKMHQQREREGELDLGERDFLRSLLLEQRNLEQLSKDVKAINELDNKLDEALTTLLKQVNQARMYENQSWQKFDAIAHELNDQKAQELYYSMDALSKNIEDISTYIQTEFSNYFNQILKTAKDQIENIKKTIKNLQEKGIDLKQQITQIAEEEVGKEVSAVPKKAELGWFARLWNYLKSWFS